MFSQKLTNLNEKLIVVKTDTVKIDSLSISPVFFYLKDKNNKLIDTALYKIDFAKSQLIVDKKLIAKELRISYKTISVDFNKKYFHKDYSKVLTASKQNKAVSISQLNTSRVYTGNDDFFGAGDLNKSGSISRGISVGNNQNAVVTSILNMQLSGKISDNVSILAAISDNNIPIQPDGSSQKLQEFDKIFISVFDDNNKLTVGDFQITKPVGYFMNLHKKQQGAMFETKIKLKNNKKLESKISGALARGKYNRQVITAIEGNQGPYRLRGAENETYIIVLSGTEKVYIDGHLLTRGKNNDYVIDYNTGEITFTAKNLITKNTRIIVEFEYSDKNYARFSVFNTNEFHTAKGDFYFNIYSQADSKNQTVNQDLTEDEKLLLMQIGDSLQNAVIYNIDSVGFNENEVLYRKTDSLGYSNVFVYSTNPNEAVYRLGFSYVGKNKGNYVKTTSAANGSVYKWVAPAGGVPQGDYEPVKLLITPKKRQMASIGGKMKLSKTFETNFELALSNHDVNTFSDIDNADNDGVAFKFAADKHFFLNKNEETYFFTGMKYRFVQKTFSAIERFNSVEFEKDWNIRNINNTNTDEHIISVNTGIRNKKTGVLQYNFDMMQKINTLQALRNSLSANYSKSGYDFNFNGSLLNSKTETITSNYLRYSSTLSKSLKAVKIGVNIEQEQNLQTTDTGYIKLPSSYNFIQYRAFLQSKDTAKTKYFAKYTFRKDFVPVIEKLQQAEQSNEINIGLDLLSDRKNILRTMLTYRDLQVKDTSVSTLLPENSLLGRIDYTIRRFKGFLVSNIFYETGSGMEEKQAFTYIKVPQGQGVYTWIDRNENGVQELDEFEVAAFSDQAEYIRIYTPSNEFIKVYTNTISQTINLFPKRIWFNAKGIKAFLARFSNTTAYKISQKNEAGNFQQNINPFAKIEDSLLVNVNNSFRNNLSFNKTAKVWGLDYIVNSVNNKTSTVNGQEQRNLYSSLVRLRVNPISVISVNYSIKSGMRNYKSQYFESRNYKIDALTNEISISYQPGVKFRLSGVYKNIMQKNLSGNEKAENNDFGLEIRYNEINKGNFQFNVNYIKISYNADVNTSVAYQILQGLYPGNNATWTVLYQRNLTDFLQLNVSYNGRMSEDVPVVHTGTVQIRAFF